MFVSDDDKKRLRTLRIIAAALTIGAPVAYLVVAGVMTVDHAESDGHIDLMFYILLLIGMVQPLVYPLMQRFQIAQYIGGNATAMTPGGLFFSLALIRLSLVEAIFIYGLVVYLISGDMMRMLWFYPIGIVWTLIHWPTESRFEQFLRKIEAP